MSIIKRGGGEVSQEASENKMETTCRRSFRLVLFLSAVALEIWVVNPQSAANIVEKRLGGLWVPRKGGGVLSSLSNSHMLACTPRVAIEHVAVRSRARRAGTAADPGPVGTSSRSRPANRSGNRTSFTLQTKSPPSPPSLKVTPLPTCHDDVTYF
ncbi:hypothetical protein Bbelb_007580 [Branchiostoma belcheri]|nr:hypothetical protein Bbelb_007580 [Branchiostoma belcheri]